MHEESTSESNTVHVRLSNVDLYIHLNDLFESIKDNEALNDNSKEGFDEKITIRNWVVIVMPLEVSEGVDITLEVQLDSSLLLSNWRPWAQKLFLLRLDQVKHVLDDHLVRALDVDMLEVDIKLNGEQKDSIRDDPKVEVLSKLIIIDEVCWDRDNSYSDVNG